jgi:hypothetical protein
VARRYRGKDVVEWLDQLGYYDLPVHDHPLKEAIRSRPNHYVTGRDGGRDIDLRQFAREGMRLYGRLRDIHENRLEFADDLEANLDNADDVAEKIKTTIDAHIEANAIDRLSRGGDIRGHMVNRLRREFSLDRAGGIRWERLSDTSARGDDAARLVLLGIAVAVYVALGTL